MLRGKQMSKDGEADAEAADGGVRMLSCDDFAPSFGACGQKQPKQNRVWMCATATQLCDTHPPPPTKEETKEKQYQNSLDSDWDKSGDLFFRPQ